MGKARELDLERRLDEANLRIQKIYSWTISNGGDLVPRYRNANKYSDGMREAKRQVSRLMGGE